MQVTSESRAHLVEWLTRVTHRCGLKQDTLFLAVNTLDRFLSLVLLSSDCFQLLGIVALWIATKQARKPITKLCQSLNIDFHFRKRASRSKCSS